MNSHCWYALSSLPYYSRVYWLPTLFFWNRRDTLIYSLAFFKQVKRVICKDWFVLEFIFVFTSKTILELFDCKRSTPEFMNENNFSYSEFTQERPSGVLLNFTKHSLLSRENSEKKIFFSPKIRRT